MRHARPRGAQAPLEPQDAQVRQERSEAVEDPDEPVVTGTPETGGSDEAASGTLPPAQSLGRSSLVMAVGTAVSRALGLVRNMLLVAAVGVTGLAADAFDIANKIPNMLFAILAGGVLNAVLVPQIVRIYRGRNPEENVGKLLTLASLVMLVITLAMTAAAPFVVRVYASADWSDAQLGLAVSFAVWCIPQLFFYGLYALLGQVLNARHQFGPYMWSPVLNNVISIAGFAAFIAIYGPAATGQVDNLSAWDAPKIALLAGTATAGIVGQAVVLLVPLYRSGFRWRVRLGLHGIGLRSVGAVAGWTFGMVMLDQLGVWYQTRLASGAPSAALADGFGSYLHDPAREGLVTGLVTSAPSAFAVAGPAAYSQALLIYLLPHSLVTVSIATALFTRMSASAAAGNVALVRSDLSRGLRITSVFTIFATAVMIVLALPITKLLLPSVDAASAVVVSQVLIAMAVGLAPLGGMALMKWVYYAFEDGRSVFVIQAIRTVILVGLGWLSTLVLPGQWWVVGLSATMSIANFAVVLLRTVGLRRRLDGIDGTRILSLLTRVTVATLVAAGAGLLVKAAFGDLFGLSWTYALAVTVTVGLVMTVVYVVVLRALRVQELTGVVSPVLARLRRR
ncbi:murein biosynthesis integral membrane protein MurJ [Cellulomonas sp. PhB143]|uniref:murein biosynthesis integral membrane protein MurJ n=1 Tax=Cellulomonas sp. PhB143 TaxID=2485186 RepID=UPI000F94F0AD|nr:murein biosynthesis integral membrane protein MurJ [Cellulomonas sp. PhB143]ROS75532.1 putative peptidoglycan lipid II flippase [Cellulomonas sp. PhB143]